MAAPWRRRRGPGLTASGWVGAFEAFGSGEAESGSCGAIRAEDAFVEAVAAGAEVAFVLGAVEAQEGGFPGGGFRIEGRDEIDAHAEVFGVPHEEREGRVGLGFPPGGEPAEGAAVVGVAVVSVGQDDAAGFGGLEDGVEAGLVFRGICHVAAVVFGEAVEVEFVFGQAEGRATGALFGFAGGGFGFPIRGEGVFDAAGSAGEHVEREACGAGGEVAHGDRHHFEVIRVGCEDQPVADFFPRARVGAEDGGWRVGVHDERRPDSAVGLQAETGSSGHG